MIEIIKCGTKATPKLNNMEAIIIACELRFNQITYQLAWFVNGERKTDWMNENEFTIEEVEKQKIGFKQ